jgi:hypothetical protein
MSLLRLPPLPAAKSRPAIPEEICGDDSVSEQYLNFPVKIFVAEAIFCV